MKTKTQSFVLTLKLKTEIYQEHILEKRFNSGRQLYNILLGKYLNIQKKLKESYEYKELIKEYIIEKKKLKLNNEKTSDTLKLINIQFNELNNLYGFTEYNLHKLSTEYRKQFKNDIDSNTVQKIATRVHSAVMKYHFRKGGKPRYKGYGKLKSLEGKTNTMGIRFIDNKLLWGRKLEIPAILKENDIVQTHGLNQRIKYVRVVKKSIRGSVKYFVQLILEGEAFNKFEAEETCNAERIVRGNIGIDLGPQTIAYVGNEKAEIRVLAEKINRIIKDKKKIQQKLSRKLRLLNPEQFEPNFSKNNKRKLNRRTIKLGKIKKGGKCKNFSNNYKKLREKLSEIERKQAELRKESHGQLINELLRMGNNFYMEKISYKAWQKMFGKSIGARAPGLFVELLRRKAEKAGGSVIEFNTQTTALSQVCICGAKVKKPLSQRIHSCECGVKQQRDVFSAYLALFVVENKLDYIAAKSSYTGFEQRLWLATKDIQNLSSSSKKILSLREAEIEGLANLISEKTLTVCSI